jgi:hypothetical protein
MLSKTLFSFFTIFFGCSVLLSQVDSTKKFSIQSFNFQTIFTDNSTYLALIERKDNDFKTYVLSSSLSTTLLPEQFTVVVKPQYGVNIELFMKQNKKSMSFLRVGINSFTEVISVENFNVEKSHIYDTIVSANNEIYYFDSVTIKKSAISFSSQQIRLNANYIFRINPVKRWSYFGGFGFSAGMSYKSTTNISSITSFGAAQTLGTNSYQYPNVITPGETIVTKPTYGFIINSPVGVDFRIGNRNKLLKRLHLHYELRPSYNLITIARQGFITNLNMQHGVGVRYVLR